MPVNLLQASSPCRPAELLSSDSKKVELRPRGKEPGRVINDQWPHIAPGLAGPGGMVQAIRDHVK